MRSRIVGSPALACAALALAACGSDEVEGSLPVTDNDAATIPVTDAGSSGRDASASDGTASSDASSDASKDATVTPAAFPIKHVIVIVKENHTFDNYFGTFPGAEGTTKCKTSNGIIDCPHAPDRPVLTNLGGNLCHSHDCAVANWNNGAMDGWDKPGGSAPNGTLAYGQYSEQDIPSYWAYARTYALADHFFSSMLGPSFPGHAFYLAAQSNWAVTNPNLEFTHPYWGCDQASSSRITIENQQTCTNEEVHPCFDIPSVPDILPAGIDWKFYGSNFYLMPEVWSMFNAIKSVRNGPGWQNVVKHDDFEKDIQNKTLPAVSWVVNQDLNSEHPSAGSVCAGENWTVKKINALMESDYWKDSVVLIAYDDFGGWYDHVPPPRQYGCNSVKPYGLGFRLPLILISPYAKPGSVFKEVSDQSSVPRFIEKVFGATKTLHDLDPSAQDHLANDLMNAFDFKQTPLPPLVRPIRTCL